MQKAILEQYRVADFVQWHDGKLLTLNPDFQRGSVWNLDGKTYFIDSILNGYPTPKVYLRTNIDPITKKTVRDIVDGQQRIRTLIEFASNQLRLNYRSKQFAGLRYEDLTEEIQGDFLSYSIGVDQLISATRDEILEVFTRLNTYSVPLNAAELRHARFTGQFAFTVTELSKELGDFFRRYGMFSVRDQVRMLHDEFVAQLFGLLIDGVANGGRPYIDKLYERMDKSFPSSANLSAAIRDVIHVCDEDLTEVVQSDLFSRPPQFLILFAAVAHSLQGIPAGVLASDFPNVRLPVSPNAVQQLLLLDRAVSSEIKDGEMAEFVGSVGGATVRAASRRVRFRHIWKALVGDKV